MKRIAIFAAAAAAVITVVAMLLGTLFSAPADHRAIRVSALIAYAVQLFAFAVVFLARRANLFAAWGVGMLMRFAALALVAFLLVRGMGLRPEPALLSLAAFFFLTTLVEPLLLTR